MNNKRKFQLVLNDAIMPEYKSLSGKEQIDVIKTILKEKNLSHSYLGYIIPENDLYHMAVLIELSTNDTLNALDDNRLKIMSNI